MWVYGANMPGYMPDEEYREAETWAEARDALLWDVERADEGAWGADAGELDVAERELREAPADEPFAVRCGRFVLCVERAA